MSKYLIVQEYPVTSNSYVTRFLTKTDKFSTAVYQDNLLTFNNSSEAMNYFKQNQNEIKRKNPILGKTFIKNPNGSYTRLFTQEKVLASNETVKKVAKYLA